jgi:hypothetical protein
MPAFFVKYLVDRVSVIERVLASSQQVALEYAGSKASKDRVGSTRVLDVSSMKAALILSANEHSVPDGPDLPLLFTVCVYSDDLLAVGSFQSLHHAHSFAQGPAYAYGDIVGTTPMKHVMYIGPHIASAWHEFAAVLYQERRRTLPPGVDEWETLYDDMSDKKNTWKYRARVWEEEVAKIRDSSADRKKVEVAEQLIERVRERTL